MTKGKKQNLSAEELLKQALVPEGEQPYEVPKNWCWVKFNNLKDSDTSFFDGDWILSENMDPNGNVRLIQLSDIGIGEFLDKSAKFISEHTFNELDCSQLCEGDVLISRMAEPIARSCILPKMPMKCITAVDVAVMRCNSTIVLNKYVNYLCNASWFTDLANNLARGTTRVRITRKNLGDMPFPLPPLTEQQRIVDRIERLFAKLDQAKELAQNVLDSFETRKATILHKAFTGELTAKWREKHGVSMDSWVEKELISVFKFIDYRGKTPTKTDDGIPLITAKNVKKGYIDYSIREYISADEFEERKSRGVATKGDILFTTEAPLGNVAISDIEMYSTAQRLIVLQQNGSFSLSNKYVMYYMLTSDFQSKLDDQKTGSTVAGIKASKLKQITVVLPTFLEQIEIERILDKLFDYEQKAKELIDIIDHIDLLKKALLARAFRGELGTNDPSEECALDLLKEVIVAQ